MKLLVTGACGLVGSATAKYFYDRGYEVIGIDNNQRAALFGTPKQDTDNIKVMDIRDEETVRALINTHQFDVIVHAAAQPSHDWSATDPITDFDINARGTLNLLEAVRRYSPHTTFIFVSTDKVYGENMIGERLSDESLGLDFAGKRSPFGCSKTAADIYVQEYGNYFGIKTACFRPGCITGKNHQGAEYHGFLAYLAKCIKEGIPYKIFGDGTNVRDQIHADDLAAAFYVFAQNPKVAAVYNMGGGPERAVSILEAIKLIEDETGYAADVEYHDTRKGDRLYDIHDITKFKTDYPEFEYKYSLQDIIKELCGV